MSRKENCAMKALIILGFISATTLATPTPTTITAPPVSTNVISQKDDLKDFLGHCLHKKDVSKCLKARVIDVIDDVTGSDEPLSVNLFNLNMSLNKNPHFKDGNNVVDTSRAFADIMSHKLKHFLESRVIHVKLADEADTTETPSSVNEARKKKDGGKHGNTMMMGGMALMAFLAQLFLSKVAFMAGAALILAKIALLFSALNSLKKSSGSGGSEHVVYSADVGKQGWQRSIHTMSPVIAQQQQQIPDDIAYRGHSTMPSYDGV